MPATLLDIQAKYGDQVYPLYKDEMHAPYMENDGGTGYKGVVMYDEHLDRIQCSECGKWFKRISKDHLLTHKINNVFDYKKKYEIQPTTPLCSVGFSKKLSELAIKRKMGIGEKYHSKCIKNKFWEKSRIKSKESVNTVGHKNKFGLCDAQIAARLEVVKSMSGKNKVEDITAGDLRKCDKKLYYVIQDKYGSVRNGCDKLGIKAGTYSDADLLADLRTFVIKNKRVPKALEINVDFKTYQRHFGSWSRAKMMAGLDQLLEEVKSA